MCVCVFIRVIRIVNKYMLVRHTGFDMVELLFRENQSNNGLKRDFFFWIYNKSRSFSFKIKATREFLICLYKIGIGSNNNYLHNIEINLFLKFKTQTIYGVCLCASWWRLCWDKFHHFMYLGGYMKHETNTFSIFVPSLVWDENFVIQNGKQSQI